MSERIGDGPIDRNLREAMNILARVLDDTLNSGAKGPNRTTGFVLLAFPFGSDDGRCNYISNASRDDVLVLLKEQVRRFEGAPDVSGKA